MFTLAHAKEIYAFFTPDGRKRDLTTEKVTSLLRTQLDLPFFPDAIKDVDVDVDEVNSPNRIPADRAQEAIIYVLEKIFGLKAAEGRLGKFEKVYKIFTSVGKGGYYQSLFRLTISHTFLKIEQKSKRPNLSKSKADCIKKYQAYWVPVRVSKSAIGEWFLSEPYVPGLFVDTTTILPKGCKVSVIHDNEKKREWENSTEVGKVSLISLSYALKNACAEVIRFLGKDADNIFKSSNFCTFFYFIKRAIEEATESIILPYLTPPRVKDVPVRVSGASSDILQGHGYEIIGEPQVFMPASFTGLFSAQYSEKDLIKTLVTQEWTEQSNENIASLLKAYADPKINKSFINYMSLNHPIIQLLIPSTFVNIEYKDISANLDIEVLWRYGEFNEAILAIGSPFHKIYDMYPDLTYKEYIDEQERNALTTALAKDISRISLNESKVSLVFIQIINQKSLEEVYILNSIYLDPEMVNDTIGEYRPFTEVEEDDDGDLKEVVYTKTSYTSSIELNEILCASLKLFFNIASDFNITKMPSVYLSDLITTNIPKSRMYSILFDCLNLMSFKVVNSDASLGDSSLFQIIRFDR